MCWLARRAVSLITPWRFETESAFPEIHHKESICKKVFVKIGDLSEGFIGETEDVIYIAHARLIH